MMIFWTCRRSVKCDFSLEGLLEYIGNAKLNYKDYISIIFKV